MDKLFVAEEERLLDGFRLGRLIYESGFRPSFIVGLWRGGSAVGIVVQECLAVLGVETDHIALRTSYAGMDEYAATVRRNAPIRVHGKQYLLDTLRREDRLLIVDDVYSSGRHVHAVIDALRVGTKRNMPADVRVAALWFRPTAAGRAAPPHFHLRETDKWLVLPHELQGITHAEIARHKPYLLDLLGTRASRPLAGETPALTGLPPTR